MPRIGRTGSRSRSAGADALSLRERRKPKCLASGRRVPVAGAAAGPAPKSSSTELRSTPPAKSSSRSRAGPSLAPRRAPPRPVPPRPVPPRPVPPRPVPPRPVPPPEGLTPASPATPLPATPPAARSAIADPAPIAPDGPVRPPAVGADADHLGHLRGPVPGGARRMPGGQVETSAPDPAAARQPERVAHREPRETAPAALAVPADGPWPGQRIDHLSLRRVRHTSRSAGEPAGSRDGRSTGIAAMSGAANRR